MKDDDDCSTEFVREAANELEKRFDSASRRADDDDRRGPGLSSTVHDVRCPIRNVPLGRNPAAMRYNPAMGTDAAVVQRLLDAFARRDADAIAGMVADDFLFEPLSTEAADRDPYRGGEGMRSYLRDVTETWRQFDVKVGVVEEVHEHVLVTGRVYARARRSSLVADDPVAFAWKVVDGRARWGKVFLSEAAARQAIRAA